MEIEAKEIDPQLAGWRQRNLLEIVCILKQANGLSFHEIAEKSGRPVKGVKWSLKLLREREMAHVGEWRRQPDGRKGPMTPLFVAGPGVDASKPEKYGKQELQRRYMLRRRSKQQAPACPEFKNSLGIWKGLIR